VNTNGLNLPTIVALPTEPEISAAALRSALGGVSRQSMRTWRLAPHFFPQPANARGRLSFTSTSAVASWLAARGVKIVWC
jgi:hypothetical protein